MIEVSRRSETIPPVIGLPRDAMDNFPRCALFRLIMRKQIAPKGRKSQQNEKMDGQSGQDRIEHLFRRSTSHLERFIDQERKRLQSSNSALRQGSKLPPLPYSDSCDPSEMSFAHQTPLRARFTSGTSTPGKELRALLNDFDEDSPLPTLPGEDNKFATEARQSPSLGKGLPAHRVRNGFGVGERGKDGSASPFRRSVSLQDGALPDRRYINLLANSTSSSSSTYHDRKDKDSSTLPVLPSPKQQLSYSQNTPPTSSTIMSQSHDNNSGGSRRSAYSQTSSSRSGLTNTSTNADHSMAVTPPFDIGDETHPRSGGSNDSGLSSSQAQRGGGRFYGSQSRYPKASGLAGRRVVSQPMPSDSGVGVGERYETENPDGVVDLVQTLGGRDAAAERRARMESNESRYDISELGLSTISSAGEVSQDGFGCLT